MAAPESIVQIENDALNAVALRCSRNVDDILCYQRQLIQRTERLSQ